MNEDWKMDGNGRWERNRRQIRWERENRGRKRRGRGLGRIGGKRREEREEDGRRKGKQDRKKIGEYSISDKI